MSAARRIAYPLRLVRARLAHRAGRLALVAVGIAAGAAVLCLVYAGALVIRDRSLERATAALPASERAVQATWFGTLSTGPSAWPALDRVVRPRLRAVTGQEPAAAMLYREASIDGRLVDLRAVDGVRRYARLVSGRWPRPCVPARCEVLRIAGTGPLPSKPTLRLIEVGRATLPADAPYRDFLGRPPADTSVLARAIRYHAPPQPPLVLAEGVRGLARTPELATFYRSYAWFVPIEPGDVHPWTIARLQARIDRLRSEIGADSATGTAFDVTAPTRELAAAADRGRSAARRLLLLGGEAAALLLAFVLLAAASLRRDAEAARRRLSWLGARRWQLALASLSESGAVAAAATLAGWAAGIGLAALAASAAGVPAGEALRHSAASATGAGIAVGLAAAAALLLFAALRAPAVRVGGGSLSAVDAAALGALLAIVVGLARGRGRRSRESGTGAFLLLLPGPRRLRRGGRLRASARAAPARRSSAPAGAGRCPRGSRRSRWRGTPDTRPSPSPSSSSASASRSSPPSTARRSRPGSATRRPTPCRPTTCSPRTSRSSCRSRRCRGRRARSPVVRESGDVARLETSQGADVLGIPRPALASLDGWRGDFASEAARRSSQPPCGRQRPVSLGRCRSAGAHARAAAARARLPDRVRATVQLANGDFARCCSGRRRPAAARCCGRGSRPARPACSGSTFGQLNGGRRSANAGTGIQPTARGTLRLDLPGAAGPTGRLVGGVTAVGAASSATPSRRTSTAASGSASRQTGSRCRRSSRPRSRARPALTDGCRSTSPASGSSSGSRASRRGSPARRSGTSSSPTRGSLSIALDTAQPGLGRPNELWLDAPAAAADRFSRPPYDVLAVQSRAEVEAALRDDPLARGALLVLAGTALVALGLAVVGLLLGLLADLRDESGELFDLETQGAPPRLLRRHLRLRALAVAAAGVLGGLATGAVLSALVLDLVRLTANVAAPEPPLALTLDWRIALGAALVYAAVAAAAVLAASRPRAAGRFREVGA